MGKPKIEMVGRKFNRLTVVSEAEKPENTKRHGQFWNCICECGNKKVAFGVSLRNGDIKSCGCLRSEKSSANMKARRLLESGTLEERFFARFTKLDNGCWQWRAHTDKDGYGFLPSNNTTIRAHRLSYEIHVGKIPEGMVICHKCDNPGCVNPDHLFAGTQKDNAQDALKKKRHYIGEKNGRSKLTEEDVKEIRKSKLSRKLLEKMFGVSKPTIKNIINRETWKHI